MTLSALDTVTLGMTGLHVAPIAFGAGLEVSRHRPWL